jgi:protein-disulfide isomerase-like protein with CxxC motif
MDLKALVSQVASGDVLKDIAAKAGVAQDKAAEVAHAAAEQAQAGAGNAAEMVKNIAAKTGLDVSQVENLLPGVMGAIKTQAANAGAAAEGLFDKLSATPLGGMLKGLDKDGDGNVLDDVGDAVTGAIGGVADKLGGLFGKK